MLTIRSEQMRVLVAPFFEAFVRRASAHVEKHFGDQFASMGEAVVREVVLRAVERAESYGFSTDEDVMTYLALMFVFGRDFDQDPRLPWAREALHDRGQSASFRMSRLRTLALMHQGAGRGYLARQGPESG